MREVSSYRYLVTVLDAGLTVLPQLGRLNQNWAQKLNTFRKIRKCRSQNTAVRVYKATLLPILDYSDLIYELLNKAQLQKLQRLQNKGLRVVFWGAKPDG